ncbi:Cadherin-2 [Dissostichus eleginoides]|uniref:Cadherin-2 n=1 Tax=Dissostichus eleginoides TaxID=100907 RepID=A0AAD9CCB7_DISEL|nr:Cadherin-2 [Dissostichus eleginoides]
MEITRPRLFLILCLLVHSSSLKILKRQKRDWIIDSFTIREDHEGGFPYELGQLKVEKKFSFFKIHGEGVELEPKNLLQINENTGMLTVHGPVDYEKFKVLKGTGRVKEGEENVLVKRLQITDRDTKETLTLSTTKVTVIVEDVNDPPIFDMTNKHVTVAENTKAGHYLATFAATDPDASSASTIVYTKGDDPADWVRVDPKTGNITTTKIIDRESHFVKDNTYKANITAVDLDQDPFGGPFSFKLQEKEKGKWKIDPTQGYTTKLVKERTVHSGVYDLVLKVYGLQGEEAVYNLSVIVCNCVDITKPNCSIRKAKGSGLEMEQRYQRWCSRRKKLYALSAPAEELGDYDPHNYTEEGDEKHNFDLDAISIPDTPFDPELDLDLDFRFDTLASICMSSKKPCLQYKT